LRTTICIEVYRRVYKGARNKETTIDGIPSPNRWSNGKNKPGDRNISMTLCELPTRQLDRLASCSRISVQQQETCSNQKHVVTRRTPFELNFGRHPWKGNLVVQMEIPRVEEFLTGIKKSWEQATKVIEEA